ncbi:MULTISPECIES: GNAT family N-acetyltransferase [Aquimarina]|uniref:GNAT family N-acetyltransferase n=1 Tax=Aquimarina TaxID=290174 RepID=UPI000D691676|nr:MULTISPECIES: GNAT family N-acetyltransferase [Aquimarina]
MKLFETKRLSIRYLKKEDLIPFFDMQSNLNVMRYIKKHMSFEESKQELERFMKYYQDDEIFYNIWAVVDNNSNEFVGLCGVYKNETFEYEIAYRLRECFWGKGFGREIAKGLIAYCFNKMKLEQLTAYVSKDNIGSVHILEKEMKYVKEFYSEENGVELKYILNQENSILNQ